MASSVESHSEASSAPSAAALAARRHTRIQDTMRDLRATFGPSDSDAMKTAADELRASAGTTSVGGGGGGGSAAQAPAVSVPSLLGDLALAVESTASASSDEEVGRVHLQRFIEGAQLANAWAESKGKGGTLRRVRRKLAHCDRFPIHSLIHNRIFNL